MQRYFIHLAYNGLNYCGWQNQPNAVTVQQTIEQALSILLRTPIAIVGAGRTDSGVHARMMTAHFDADLIDHSQLTFRLNNFLSQDIVIYSILPVNMEAHARFDALSRTYKYYVTEVKDPFSHSLKYKVSTSLDVQKMNECSEILFEYQDFTSFSKLHTDARTNNCLIMDAVWEKDNRDYVFTITANRFLRNMVRAIVGTMLEVGRGKISVHDFRTIIEAKDRGRAGSSAPGHALFLERVSYPDSIYL